MKSNVETVLKRTIADMAEQQGLNLKTIEDHDAIVADLGFSSMDVATLTALLEKELGVNPFFMGICALSDIRTIREIINVYEHAIKIKNNTAPTKDEVHLTRAQARQNARAGKKKT